MTPSSSHASWSELRSIPCYIPIPSVFDRDCAVILQAIKELIVPAAKMVV